MDWSTKYLEDYHVVFIHIHSMPFLVALPSLFEYLHFGRLVHMLLPAPLDISPETIAIVCSYYGFLNWVRENLKEEVLVVKPLRDRDVVEKIRDFTLLSSACRNMIE